MEQEKQRISEEEARAAGETLSVIVDNIETLIIGKRPVVELVVLALVAKGHVLIEDVPGVGKTSLVSALAKSISCGFQRIQFTPDTMPSDVTGFSVYNQKNGEFEFKPGAVMSNLILADEINRASAKTQASLLEAMEEKQVTVDSKTYPLEEPFMVLATQNPVDSFGTYPLPEAQIDRFLIRVSLGSPSLEEEIRVVTGSRTARTALRPVAQRAGVLALREAAGRVYVSPGLTRYLVEITAATRTHPDVLLGSSPRGGIALYELSRAYALARGHSYVLPDDVKYLAPFVLAHRLTLTHEAKLAKRTGGHVVADILQSVLISASDE